MRHENVENVISAGRCDKFNSSPFKGIMFCLGNALDSNANCVRFGWKRNGNGETFLYQRRQTDVRSKWGDEKIKRLQLTKCPNVHIRYTYSTYVNY